MTTTKTCDFVTGIFFGDFITVSRKIAKVDCVILCTVALFIKFDSNLINSLDKSLLKNGFVVTGKFYCDDLFTSDGVRSVWQGSLNAEKPLKNVKLARNKQTHTKTQSQFYINNRNTNQNK